MASLSSPADRSNINSAPSSDVPVPVALPAPSVVPAPVPMALPTSSAPQRLPPLCWTPEETTALINAYRDKWYALGCSNLKASNWQEVADEVALMAFSPDCTTTSTPKTALQCRLMMARLRKHYRIEIQRARSTSWAHFNSMDSLEKGPAKPNPPTIDLQLEEQDDNQDSLYEKFKNAGVGSSKHPGKAKVGEKRLRERPACSSSVLGREINGGVTAATRVVKEKSIIGSSMKEKEEPVNELVNAIKLLGDRFVRVEQKKMEVAREIENKRMEMEMKHTKEILESQERIAKAIAKAISKKKKNKNKNKSKKN